MNELASSMDTVLYHVSSVLCGPLFGAALMELGAKHQLPLLTSGSDDDQRVPAFALLEAAYYDSKVSSRIESCAAHYDPGLFSLNVLSNQPGLQFQDAKGRWIAAPAGDNKYGILWAGAAARDASSDVKPAIHRVIRPSQQEAPPRLSVWSEICTREQVFLGSIEEGKRPTQIRVTNLFGCEPYTVAVKEGGVLEAMRLIQELKGLPMSKTMKVPIYNDENEVCDIVSGW
jgi:hypothetical protein